MNRVRSLLPLAAALALALLLAGPMTAQEKGDKNTHTGTFVSAAEDGKSFTMKDNNGKEHKHAMAKDAKCLGTDGKECKLSDFKKDQKIRVTTKEDDSKVATKVEALK